VNSSLLQIDELKVEKQGNIICEVDKFCVAERERVAVVGANGCGKTTLLRVLATLETNYSGRLQEADPLHHKLYVHQSPVMFRGSVLFNTCYGLICQGIPASQRKEIALDVLEKLGIAGLAKRDCKRLSGGEKRRVAVARAAIVKPDLLLLDEPFADVDEAGTAAICQLLQSLTKTAIIVASPQSLPHQLGCREFKI
jgi:tungstate transport system ATP-binding protein